MPRCSCCACSTGIASAAAFVAGGLLAARLASGPAPGSARRARSRPAGLVLGIYYGGTGLGIIVSALLVEPLAARSVPHAWQAAWIALGAVALLATAGDARADAAPRGVAGGSRRRRAGFAGRRSPRALPATSCSALGYIGYMTFVITLLREQRMDAAAITGFYVVLGVGVIASSWLWAGLLQRSRGGGAFGLAERACSRSRPRCR